MPLIATLDALQGYAILAVAALVAGAVNSFAGGGTILTFPVLGAILPDLPGRLVTANATSTIGLWPGAATAAWAYRGERADLPAWARWLVVPSVAGAIVGTALVLVLPPEWFDALVPWLILVAAVLFACQPRLAAMGTSREQLPLPLGDDPGQTKIRPLPLGDDRDPTRHLPLPLADDPGQTKIRPLPLGDDRDPTRHLPLPLGEGRGEGAPALPTAPAASPHVLQPTARARIALACGLQFLVSVYGGYFGAGIGILMLAVLGMLGLGDIHRLNGVKNVLGTVVNGVSAAVFALGALAGWHAVSWPHAAVMAVAATVGSLGASHLARRLPARIVRRGVALISFALAAYYFLR